jgi:hypothetical protein
MTGMVDCRSPLMFTRKFDVTVLTSPLFPIDYCNLLSCLCARYHLTTASITVTRNRSCVLYAGLTGATSCIETVSTPPILLFLSIHRNEV